MNEEQCYKRGKEDGKQEAKSQTIKDILDIIKKLEVKPKDNSITRFTPYIYSEAIQAQIQSLDKTEQKKQ
jgi:hypothetical protein